MDNYAHRRSTAGLRFTDAAGKPLADAEVSYRLKEHEFLFGIGAFDALPASARQDPGSIDFYQDKPLPDRAFYQDRTDKMAKVFNYGTLPFYWGGFEPEEGAPLTESRMDAAVYLADRGIRTKGHPLCWHTACADWLMKYDNKTILQKQLDRICRDVTAFKGVIDIWDVINEAVIMPVYDRYDNAITRVCREYGQVELIRRVFEAARQCNPDALLLINDFNLSDSYADLIARCLDAGVPIGAIGLQTHQHQGYHGREWFEEVLERFSVFGLPLHFTENTLVSGQLMPADIVDLNDYQVDEWPSTPEGEERQRREWKQMVELLFAHPLVEAVTGWDLADGGWLHAPSGLLREDNTPKPAYWELDRLVNREWTSEGILRTDAEGYAVLEGYRGLYSFRCRRASGEFRLQKTNSGNSAVCLSEQP